MMRLAALLVLALPLGDTAVAKPKPPPPPAQAKTSATTGFDVSILPAEESADAVWFLDGVKRTEKLPAQLRKIAPGKHVIRVEPASPWLDTKISFKVTYNQVTKVEITLAESP